MFWMDFDESGKKHDLLKLSNEHLPGLLGVCKPLDNGEMHYLIGVTVMKIMKFGIKQN